MVKVVGIGAKPLAGVTVKAFTSSIPEEGEKSTSTSFINRGSYPFPGERHATLTHATAESDAHGVAQFEGLTVTGTSDQVVYISFFANGKLLSWSNPSDGDGDGDLYVPTFKKPFFVNPNNTVTIAVQVAPSAEVTEGRPFEQQPVVMVTPARAGRIVYAVVIAKDGVVRPGKVTAPFGKPDIATKGLVNATATTNAAGVASFDHLGFQAGGNVGNFRIEFRCEGNGSDTDFLVTVHSSIARVEVCESVCMCVCVSERV